jgi:hypothetical protein
MHWAFFTLQEVVLFNSGGFVELPLHYRSESSFSWRIQVNVSVTRMSKGVSM